MENILRKRLGQHPTPLDTDAIWTNIEPRLPRKRSNIPFWVWMITGVVLLGGLYLFLPQQTEGELQAVDTPPPVIVDAAPPTPPAPAAAPEMTPAPPEEIKPVPEIITPSTSNTGTSSRIRHAVPATTRTTVMANLSVQESAPAPVRKRAQAAVSALPLPHDYAQVKSRYERFTFLLPEIVVPVVITALPSPNVTTAKTALPAQPAKGDERTAVLKVEQAKVDLKETQRLAEIKLKEQAKQGRNAEKEAQRVAALEVKQAEAQRKEAQRLAITETKEQVKREYAAKKEAQRLAVTEAKTQAKRNQAAKKETARLKKVREEIAAKTDRERQKEQARQDWLQARESGKANAIVRKEDARLETERRIQAYKAQKEQDKLTQEILKKNKDKYAKADREARLAELGQRRLRRMQNRLARLDGRQTSKADRLAAREARRAARALAKAWRKKPEKMPKNIRKKQPAYWTVEPGIAVSLPGRSVNVAGDNPDGNQVNVNDQYEKALEGITLQGLVGYHRPSGLSLRTGFAYSRINSKVESEFITIGTEPVQAVVAIIESPDGSRREQTGTVQVATETTTTERYYNSVSSIDIPLLLGYRFEGTKWGLTLEAGPTFNLSSGGSANLYDGAGNYRIVSSEHFLSKLTGRCFLANLGGAYNLSKKTMLTANLRLQGFGKDGFEDPSSGYATKYTLFGIQLGYRIRF